MAALTESITNLEERVAQIEKGRAALIPVERYNSAAILLKDLAAVHSELSYKYRFARKITGFEGAPDFQNLRESVAAVLTADFDHFVTTHLTHKDPGAQIRPLIAAIKPQIKLLDAHVADYKGRIKAELEAVRVQVDLFKALTIADHTAIASKLGLRFEMLMRRYEELSWSPALESEWNSIKQELADLKEHVKFDSRLGLSKDSLAFVQRVLAGKEKAPSLLELTPAILAELKQLTDFARNVKILRS
ncbi:MAG TPA: hypothetical protein VD969_23395 [Symbiobacteriaceae bacterium]|nr:hypothetical protein [Symbiobacteriaceae bacterium]